MTLGFLRQLKGRSPHEISVRGRQFVQVQLERVRGFVWNGVPGDEFLRWRLRGDAPREDAALRKHVVDTIRERLAPGLRDLHGTVRAIAAHAPDYRDQLLQAAQQCVDGRFDVLGYRGVSYGTPIDWHSDPIHRKRAPRRHWSRVPFLDSEAVGDHKIIWEINRHQHLVTLGQAYQFTGDETFVEVVVDHLESWMGANPPSLGINWSSSLEVAFRAMAWMWTLALVGGSPRLTDAHARQWLKFIYLHGRHIETFPSTYFSPNTHLTGEALALYMLGRCLPCFRRAARWEEMGWSILCEQIQRQVRDDGTYFEQATAYHRYTAEFYTTALVLAQQTVPSGLDQVRARTSRAVDCLANLVADDGSLPLMGDDDGGRTIPFDYADAADVKPLLGVAATLFERADWRRRVSSPPAAVGWLLGATGLSRFAALKPAGSALTSKGFRGGGFYVMRDGGERGLHMVCDAGPHGSLNCAHSHADALSFVASIAGIPLLVDSGTYTYDGRLDTRDSFRHSAAHNTVTVDGCSSAEPSGAFAWRTKPCTSVHRWASNDDLDYLDASHDGFLRLGLGVRHRRQITLVKRRFWVIRDLLDGEGLHDIQVWFHPPTGAGVDLADDGSGIVTVRRNRATAGVLIVPLTSGGALSLTSGWQSPSYGMQLPSKVLRWSGTLACPGEVVHLMVPWQSDESEQAVQPAFAVDDLVSITGPWGRGQLFVGDGSWVERGAVASDGELLWIEEMGDVGICKGVGATGVIMDGRQYRLSLSADGLCTGIVGVGAPEVDTADWGRG